MLAYLSLDIFCSSKLAVLLELRSRKTVRLIILGTDNVRGQIFVLHPLSRLELDTTEKSKSYIVAVGIPFHNFCFIFDFFASFKLTA